MKLNVVIGANDSNKTRTMLNVIRSLAAIDKKVIFIDSTYDYKADDMFSFNKDIESSHDFERNDFHVKNEPVTSLKQVLEWYENAYDHIFVKFDETSNIEALDADCKFFFVQNQSKKALDINKSIIARLKEKVTKDNCVLILNDYIDECKFTREYIYKELGDANALFLFECSQVEVPLTLDDKTVHINNDVNGSIDLSEYSGSYKEALYYIAREVDESINPKEFYKKLK